METEPQPTGRRATRRGKVKGATFSYFPDQLRELAEAAHEEDRSSSDCAREALDEWLKKRRDNPS
jgi:hypothetical protein